jgi:stress response protein YsnF
VSSEKKNNKDRKEDTSTNGVTPTTGNTKEEEEEEELTSVIKPNTTGINGEIMVITPPLIKYSKVVVVRPSSQEKKEGESDPISDKAKGISKSLKQTVSTASEKAKLGNNNNVEKDEKVNKTEHSYKQPEDREGIGGQDTAAIPVNEERFSISKDTVSEDVKIEKRWISATRKVEIPVPYEEVYVNDKVVKLFDEKDDDNILSKLKDKILDSIDRDKNKQQQTISQQQQNEPGGELIPLFDDDKDNNQITEKVIPILGEEIVVSRRTVKIGEIVIKKRRVTDNKKVQIDIKKEKVMLEYPDGTTEQITA